MKQLTPEYLLTLIPTKRKSMGQGLVVSVPATVRLEIVEGLLKRFGHTYDQKTLKILQDDIREETIKANSPVKRSLTRPGEADPTLFPLPPKVKKQKVLPEH